MTRMPLVCMSMVASAFQYGWAPTLMPATTMLISPPAWVNSTMRRSTRAIQSMFSVPESMEMRAPADTANHSSGMLFALGQVQRRDDAGAFRLGQRAQRLGRVAEQHHPPDALRVQRRRRADNAGHDPGGVVPARPVGRHELGAPQVELGELAVWTDEQSDQLVRVNRAAAAGPQHLLVVVVQRRRAAAWGAPSTETATLPPGS